MKSKILPFPIICSVRWKKKLKRNEKYTWRYKAENAYVEVGPAKAKAKPKPKPKPTKPETPAPGGDATTTTPSTPPPPPTDPPATD